MSASGKKLAAAGAVALVMASGVHHKHHHWSLGVPGVPAVLTSTASPDPTAGQRAWARWLLRDEGLPRTSCNVGAVSAWEVAEGGHWANTARYNPLDTTQPEPGSYPMNSVGVQAYPSWKSGLRATITTLGNGNYPGILAALRSGGSAQAVADAVAASPWGTGPFQASC
jgi:hypothetical protein